MSTTISFLNLKGGSAKTTSAVNVANALALFHKKRVLLIDADPQSNATGHMGVFEDVLEDRQTMLHVLTRKCDISEAILHLDNIDLVPSTIEMALIEMEMMNLMSREHILSKALEEVSGMYDYVIIDLPPSLGVITTNALTASDFLFMPVQTEFFAVQGMVAVLEEALKMIQGLLNENLALGGIFGTQYDARRKQHVETLEHLNDSYKKKMMKTVIRVNTKLSEAGGAGTHIFDHAPNCNGATDYRSLTKEIIKVVRKGK